MKVLTRIFPYILYILISINGFARVCDIENLVLDSKVDSCDLTPNISYFKIEKKLSIEDILSLKKSKFKGLRESQDSIGSFSRDVWLKIPYSVSHFNEETLFIYFEHPRFREIDIYIYREKSLIKEAKGGYLRPLKENDSGRGSQSFSLPSQPGEYTAYLRLTSKSPFVLKSRLGGAKNLEMYNINRNFRVFFYYGCLFVLIMFHIFLAAKLRDITYYYYVLFAAAMLFFSLVSNRYFDFYLPGLRLLSSDQAPLYLSLPAITATLFTRAFLRLKEIAPTLDKVFIFAIAVAVFNMAVLSVDESIVYRNINHIYNSLTGLLIFGTSIYCVTLNYKPAIVFLVAWSVLIASALVWMAAKVGLLPYNVFTSSLPIWGNIFEMIIMSYALSIRLKLYKDAEKVATMKTRENENLNRTVRILCHDISNPLAVITMCSQEALQENDVEEWSFLWTKVNKASYKIKEIIEHTRKIESLKSGKKGIQLEPVRIEDVVQSSQFVFERKLKDKNVQIKTNIHECFSDICVLAEKVSLENDVLNNLISNAIKFSQPGGSIQIMGSVKDDTRFELSIADTGIGMPDEIVENIFDSNKQTSRVGTGGESGTGFGMPLVKAFLDTYGASISIETKPIEDFPLGHGTVFRIQFILPEVEMQPERLVA